MPSNQVKCLYCGKYFYRENVDYVSPQFRRYAHKKCAEKAKEIHALAKEVLGEYYLPQRVDANIKEFVKNGLSLQDIYDVAYYGYKIQTMRELLPEKSNGGFGIVPYILPEYKSYKLKQELKKKINKGKKIKDYVNKEGHKATFSVPPIKKPRGMNFFELR